MKMTGRLLLGALLAGWLSATARASDKNAGTSGAQFLKIGAGARPTAMGDAFVAVSDDVSSVYFNPAGIANISRSEMSAMHTQWIGSSNYDFGAFCYPTDHGAFAASAATLKVSDIDRRGTDEIKNGSFDSTDSAYALSYARAATPLTSFGITGRYSRQSIDNYSASTFAGDLGVIKRLAAHPVSFGLAVNHLGAPIKFRNESAPLPLTVDAGLAATLLRERLLLTSDLRWRRDKDLAFGIGAEYSHAMTSTSRFALRTGYNSAVTDAGASGVTLGGGLGFDRLDMDVAWVPFADLGNTYRYALRIRF
jgi:hypothetical protein